MDIPRLPGQRIFDLYFLAKRRFGNPSEENRGISLSDDSIAWIANDKAESAQLKSIATVRLQHHEGSESTREFRQCRIDFSGGKSLRVTDYTTDNMDRTAPRYRDFVHDLHNRLVAHGSPSARYLLGSDVTEFRLQAAFIAISLLAFIFFGIHPSWMVMLAIVFVIVLMAWLTDRARRIHPLEYSPTALPEDMFVGKNWPHRRI